MSTLHHSECASTLVALGLSSGCIVRALMNEVGFSRAEAVRAITEARREEARARAAAEARPV